MQNSDPMAAPSILTSSLFFLSMFVLSSSKTSSSNLTHIPSLPSFCQALPYPQACLRSSVSTTISPTARSASIQSLRFAISEATGLSAVLLAANPYTLLERQKGTVKDCRDLHQVTLSALRRSVSDLQSGDEMRLTDVRAYLAAALTNRVTCLEGLDSATGPLKPSLVEYIARTYQYVSNSLSLIKKPDPLNSLRTTKGRRLLEFPEWMLARDRRILQGGEVYEPGQLITVATDGSGDFSTISDAIDYAPENSDERIVIRIIEGVYLENVEIPRDKTNIMLQGDGVGLTVITGNRNAADGWTTFSSATVAVSGEGFIARDITFENTAGPTKYQAVALRVNADFAAIYKCEIRGYQDSLYVHTFRQFYRECNIFGTIDFIFGNAAVVFQACIIVSRKPLEGQFTVVTSQSRDNPAENTGISIQNCTIIPDNDMSEPSSYTTRSYLGRPGKNYSRTVVLSSYIDGFIDPAGWAKRDGDKGLDTLYYGEYKNHGAGSETKGRVDWPGYKTMDRNDAYNFTVSEFITADEWLGDTSVPYDVGI